MSIPTYACAKKKHTIFILAQVKDDEEKDDF